MKFYLPVLFSFLLVATSFGQKPITDQTEEEVNTMLVANWQIIAQEVEGQKLDVPAGKKGFMNFMQDGTLIFTIPGSKESMTWSYNHAGRKISTTLQKEKDYFTIVTISSTELVLLHTSEGYSIKLFLKRIG